MDEATNQRAQKLLVSRLEAMGIEMTPLPGGRCALGELGLQSPNFQATSGDLRIPRVRFSTVGGGHLKCLSPQALFQLPLIPVGSCNDARQIEDRIRAAWSRHIQALRDMTRALHRLGAVTREELGGAGVAFSLGLDDPNAMARCLDARHVVLPACGPLSGLPLPSEKRRIARFDATAEAAVDLEIDLTGRIEAIGREAGRAEEARRSAAAQATEAPAPARSPLELPTPAVGGRILLVGGVLGRDQALRSALQRLGFKVRIEYTSADALAAFRQQSFDVVLTDAHLGRSEGIELIPEIGALPGIEKLPVVLVDEHARRQRREAARSLGAAGYLVHPIDCEKVLPGIQRMASGGRRGRRFRRMDRRLDVDWGSARGSTRSIARGGVFVRSEVGVLVPDAGVLELALPELGEHIRVETRTVYRRDHAGLTDSGVGLRFHRFPDRNEARWIEYLTALMNETRAD